MSTLVFFLSEIEESANQYKKGLFTKNSPVRNRLQYQSLFSKAARFSEVKPGLTCGHAYETLAKQAMIESSLYKILLVDSSKFNRITPNFFSCLDEMDHIITDRMICADNRKKFEDLGLNLKIV